MANNAQDVLAKARADIGYSRWTDPQQGTKYGRYFRDVLKWGSYYGVNGVPYCGMAVTYWFDMAGAKCPGIPGAYTPTMAMQGRQAGKEVNRYSGKPGDVVYFDWSVDGEIDHVGIIESNHGNTYTTIEGNTNNGVVARRSRAIDNTIACIIRPAYDDSSSPVAPSAPSSSVSVSKSNENIKIAQAYLKKFNYDIGRSGIDGIYGPDSKRAVIKYVQYNMNYYGAGLSVDGSNGPLTKQAWSKYGPVKLWSNRIYLVKAVQIALMLRGYSVGSYGIDGSCGEDTVKAIKAFQTDQKIQVDGVVGANTFALLF